jgi:hypothetical protein
MNTFGSAICRGNLFLSHTIFLLTLIMDLLKVFFSFFCCARLEDEAWVLTHSLTIGMSFDGWRGRKTIQAKIIFFPTFDFFSFFYFHSPPHTQKNIHEGKVFYFTRLYPPQKKILFYVRSKNRKVSFFLCAPSRHQQQRNVAIPARWRKIDSFD